jgi:hypothetical protein
MTTSFVSIAEVRALVRSRLGDVDLQAIIDREESWLATKVGALAGARSDTFNPGIANVPLYLPRLATLTGVTDGGIALSASDYRFTPSSGCLQRATQANPWPSATNAPFGYAVPGVEPFFPSWQSPVVITWTPADAAAVAAAVIGLVRGTVGETGMDSETIGDYQYTRGQSAARLSRANLVRTVLLRRPAYSMRLRTSGEPA